MPRGKSTRASASRPREEDGDERTQRGPRAQWSGTLSFGLVSIPVDLHAGTRAGGVSLRLLAQDGTLLSRRFYRPDDDEPLASDQLTRGYEHEKGEHVEISDEELEALQPEKSRDIDLRQFVALSELDPAYFERLFFLAPGGQSTKAYRLLASVMEQRQLAGIATFVMREREYLVAIIAEDGLLRAQTLRFASELRSTDALDIPSAKRVTAEELAPFVKAIRKEARDSIDLTKLHDQGADAIRELAQRKARDKSRVVRSAAEDGATDQDAQIVDLFEVLQRSLANNKRDAGTLKRSLKGKSKR